MASEASSTEDERRVTLAREIVENLTNAAILDITPLGRGYNNFAWTVTIAPAKTGSARPSASQPGTTAIPAETSKLVLRMGNPAADLDESIRAENEVAALQLFRHACATYKARIIPDIYGWQNKTASSEYGWIIQEFMPGEQLSAHFEKMSSDDQEAVFDEIVQIYRCILNYKLPPSIQGFGGLRFDEKGDVAVGPIVFKFGGPWRTYDEIYEKIFDHQLALADGAPLFGGWRRNGLRERLDKFRSEGIHKILSQVVDKTPTLIHGDLDTMNILIDPATKAITALLDFDFANIAGPADELFYSFALHGLMTSLFEKNPEIARLRQFLIGEADIPEPREGEAEVEKPPGMALVDWALVAKWDAALAKAQVPRARDIKGISDLAGLYWFTQDVCSPFMLMKRWQEGKSEEQKTGKVADVEKKLVRCLEHWDY